MPNIYDNIDKHLIDALQGSMEHATRLDVCVGYFNLRGWRELAPHVDKLDGIHPCRVLIGMNVHSPDEELRDLLNQQAFDEDSGRQILDCLRRFTPEGMTAMPGEVFS